MRDDKLRKSIDEKIAALKRDLPSAHGAESAQIRERACRALDMLAKFPARVAALGPFATADEARVAIQREMKPISDALDGCQ